MYILKIEDNKLFMQFRMGRMEWVLWCQRATEQATHDLEITANMSVC